jgi:cobalt/nickel transport system permease protein
VIAAGVAAYAGINAAALSAAVEFGLQPDLFHTANGTPLYAPFHLSQTIPAMAIAHLTIAGFVEFTLTAGVVAYLQRAQLPLLRINHPGVRDSGAPIGALPGWRWAFYGLIAMMALSPLGLLAPGGAFGEDSPANLDLAKYHLSGVPRGLNDYAGFWSHTLLGGYGFSDGSNEYLGYALSAFIGAVAVAAVIGLIVAGARLGGRSREGTPAAEAA